MIKSKNWKEKTFYGTTTVGERGQVVIPAKARQLMKLKNGDKLLAFGMEDDVIVLAKFSELEKFASHLSARLQDITQIIGKS